MQRQSRDLDREVPLTVRENELIYEARKLASSHTNKIQMLQESIQLAKRKREKIARRRMPDVFQKDAKLEKEVAELEEELDLIVSTSSTADRDAAMLRDLEEKVRQASSMHARIGHMRKLREEVKRIKTIKERNLEIELKKQGFNLGGEGVNVHQLDVNMIQIEKTVRAPGNPSVLCKITLRQNITIRGGRYGGVFEVYPDLPLDTFVIMHSSGSSMAKTFGALDKFDEFIKEVVGNKTFLVEEIPYFRIHGERAFKKIKDERTHKCGRTGSCALITLGLYQSKQQRGKDVKKILDKVVNQREGKDHEIPSKVFDFLSDEATNPYMESASASARRGGKRRRKKRTKKKSRKKKRKTFKKKRKRRKKKRKTRR